MNRHRIKTIITICVLISVLLICVLSAHASVTSSTYVVWNWNETQASAVTEAEAPVGLVYHVMARITSSSTGMLAFSYKNAINGGYAITTAGPVNVTYPSPIPLIDYVGGWMVGLYGESR